LSSVFFEACDTDASPTLENPEACTAISQDAVPSDRSREKIRLKPPPTQTDVKSQVRAAVETELGENITSGISSCPAKCFHQTLNTGGHEKWSSGREPARRAACTCV